MRIYFSGIGGVGLGPLAEIALDARYGVTGSDLGYSLMTKQLKKRGVAISLDQSGDFLRREHEQTPFDWFVYTAALPDNHSELTVARELGIKTAKRDELLAHIISEKNLKLIAIAGTHGKTGTTGMLVWALQKLGIPVSYSIGTTLSWSPSGHFDPKSEYFIYECDEFDRNMLQFYPHLSIITSLDYDHADTYPTQKSYKQAFLQFTNQSEHTILWKHDANYIDLDSPASWCLQPNEIVKIKLPGEHIRMNGTLVLKALEYLQLGTKDRNKKILEEFPGTNRRFEQLAKNLYTDYGHHPAEIAATLQMARELSDNVVLVYQPHQNIRQHEIRDSYTDCMEAAQHIYWLPTHLSREKESLTILTPKELTEKLVNKKSVTYCGLSDELWSHIQIEIHKGNLVLCMGAGSIDNWLRKQLT